MGFWSKLAGIGTAVAGAVTGQPALIGAGASILAGDVASSASKDAAKIQSQASDKALGEVKGVYADQRSAFAPYQALGQGAAGSLGNLLGIAMPAMGTPMASAVPGVTPTMGMMPAQAPAAPGGPGASPQTAARAATGSSYTGGGTLGSLAGGTVLLQGPDGSVRAVPRAQAPFYESKGARVVNVDGMPGGQAPLV